MGSQQAFLELLEWLKTSDLVDLESFFEKLHKRYQLENLIYASTLKVVHVKKEQPIQFIAARNETLLKSTSGEAVLQQMLQQAWDSATPVDIDVTEALHSVSNVRLASAAGLGTHALAFPLVGSNTRRAVFSLHADMDDADWNILRPKLIHDLAAPAAYFHARQLTSNPWPTLPSNAPRLTPRESEVLSWVAVGKSYWEIAKILNISERTVRFFMANIRRKLNAVSNKQALAEAAWHGLLDETHPGRPRSMVTDDWRS